jgi:hypothetical protein
MDAEFSIEVDRPLELIRLSLAGFFRHADIARFREARRAAHEALDCALNRHLMICDIRALNIQAHEIVDAFKQMMAVPEYRARRMAFVVGATLARAQAMRALESREARWFTDPAKAEAWLFAGEVAEVPLRRAR